MALDEAKKSAAGLVWVAWLVMIFSLGGAAGGAYLSPSFQLAAGLIELEAHSIVITPVRRWLQQPPAPRAVMLFTFFQRYDNFTAGRAAQAETAWWACGGGIAGALAALALAALIAHPRESINKLFGTGGTK